MEGVWQLRKPDVVIRIPCQSGTSKCAGVFSEGGQLAVWGLPRIAFSGGQQGCGIQRGKDPILGEEEGLILKRELRMGSKVFSEYLLNE